MKQSLDRSITGEIGRSVEFDRPCLSCGYNLLGLKIADRCPECGTPISGKAAYRPTQSIFQMPTAYLTRLRLSGTLMLVATIPFVASALGFIVCARLSYARGIPNVLGLASSLVWVAAVWTLLMPRPSQATLPANPNTEWSVCRWMGRISQCCWPLAFALGGLADATANPALTNPLRTSALPFMIVAFVGVWPVCIYLARLATWAEDDGLASRLRMLPWALIICAGATIIASAFILPSLGSGILTFLLIPLAGIFAVACVLGIALTIASFVQTGNLVRWVLINRETSLTSDRHRGARIAARIDAAAPRIDPPIDPPSVPQRVWSGPATRKPQGNYLAPSSSAEAVPLAPETPPDSPAQVPFGALHSAPKPRNIRP